MTDEKRKAKIAELNDAVRTRAGEPDSGGKVYMTQAVACLPILEKAMVLKEVREYQNWTRGNDPYDEHDFGVITRITERGTGELVGWTQEPQPDPKEGQPRLTQVLFKFDYYAKGSDTFGSEAPHDPAQTDRVLTIMTAEDY